MKKGYKIPISNERSVAWVESLAKKGFTIIAEDGKIFVLIGSVNNGQTNRRNYSSQISI